jgi:hypothetical protein
MGEAETREIEIVRKIRLRIDNDALPFFGREAPRFFEIAICDNGDCWIRAWDSGAIDESILGPWKRIASSAPLHCEIVRIYSTN